MNRFEKEQATFALTSQSQATAYKFTGGYQHDKSWAIATVNDATGELTVCSDWGNWTHRWNIDHLGAPTLTHFIADRQACHYLADKLTTREERHRFDPEATVASWRKEIIRFRREGERGWTRELARHLWDELGDLASVDDQRDFVDRFFAIDDSRKLRCEPWEDFETEPTGAYLILLHGILPALVAACAQHIAQHIAARAA